MGRNAQHREKEHAVSEQNKNSHMQTQVAYVRKLPCLGQLTCRVGKGKQPACIHVADDKNHMHILSTTSYC